MSAQENVPHLFDLTKMVGKRRNEDRTVFVATVEVERRTFWLLLTGLPFALMAAGLASVLVGIWGLFVFVVVEGAWMLIMGRRRSTGLQVNMFEAMKDRKTSSAGKYLMCGTVIDPLHGLGDFQLVHSDAPVARRVDADGVETIIDPTVVTAVQVPTPKHAKGESVTAAPVDILSHLDAPTTSR